MRNFRPRNVKKITILCLKEKRRTKKKLRENEVRILPFNDLNCKLKLQKTISQFFI